MGFNKKCHTIVMHRLIEQHTDYRLNPSLEENCRPDIKKFCFTDLTQVRPDRELNGEVIKCLKVAFKQFRLTNKCEREMASILRDQALNVKLNPLLRAVCKYELETICQTSSQEDGGNAEECLKRKLLEHAIQSPACQEEVANMIEESQADIQVDPILQRACSLDLLKFCDGVPLGGGRRKYLIQYQEEIAYVVNFRYKMFKVCPFRFFQAVVKGVQDYADTTSRDVSKRSASMIK